MKMYEIKIGKKNGEKTFWRTIGTVFAGDNAKFIGDNGKPVTFVIDYPEVHGIIVPRKTKEEIQAEREERNAESNDRSNDSNNYSTDSESYLPI